MTPTVRPAPTTLWPKERNDEPAESVCIFGGFTEAYVTAKV